MSQVRLIEGERREDARGWFAETFSEARLAAAGIDCRFVQDNHSLSRARYTLRGLHFQRAPHAQAKLIRCVRGRVFDVAVDIRPGVPTFGAWTACELSAANGRQIFIPAGFAHGFLTLEDDCEIVYKCSAYYAPESEAGIAWNSVGIDWPLPPGASPVLSPRDAAQPSLSDFATELV